MIRRHHAADQKRFAVYYYIGDTNNSTITFDFNTNVLDVTMAGYAQYYLYRMERLITYVGDNDFSN